jgi:hypothetical protein
MIFDSFRSHPTLRTVFWGGERSYVFVDPLNSDPFIRGGSSETVILIVSQLVSNSDQYQPLPLVLPLQRPSTTGVVMTEFTTWLIFFYNVPTYALFCKIDLFLMNSKKSHKMNFGNLLISPTHAL